jgi:transposase
LVSPQKKKLQNRGTATDLPLVENPTDPMKDDNAPIGLPGQSEPLQTSAVTKKVPVWDPNANHGRYGANDYSGCQEVLLPLSEVKAGDKCPSCVATGDQGRLYKVEPGVILSLRGQAIITGTRYLIERVRCSLCGDYISADIPQAIAQQPKYDVSCSSTLAMARYWLGMPFKRIELWQSVQGIPMADATQWDKVKKLAKQLKPLYKLLQRLSANTGLMHYDDTPNRILLHNNQTPRKGVYTTAIVSQVGEHFIYLYCTSGHYAGENVSDLLKERSPDSGKLITMSDASSNNRLDIDDGLLERWILCFCLVHGRRKFFELLDFFDDECNFVLELISQIYKHERDCKEQGLNLDERLLYHQEKSLPLMQALRAWLANKLLYQEVEPNSGLGQSIRYMLNHWDGLTRFLHHPGAPIDNSLCERAIKVAIRHRRNSLFFKTQTGAEVGDCLMSIIHTAARCSANPFEYLNALQIHHQAMTLHPEQWLPWNYQDTLRRLGDGQTSLPSAA